MKKEIIYGLALVALLLTVRTEAAGVLTLDEALQEALAANPDVRASSYRVEAAKARIPQAKSLMDPKVGVEFMDVPIRTADVRRGDEINYMIEQELPFPGKRHQRGKAARFDAIATENNSRGQVQDILVDVITTYYDLYRLDRQLDVVRENTGLLRSLRSSTETWYAAGKAPAAIPLKAQVELTMLKNSEILLKQERLTHEAHLQALLGRPTHEAITLPRKLRLPRTPASLDQILNTAQGSRPELGSLEAMTKREKAKLTEARLGLLPDLSLGFKYDQRPGMEDAWTGTASINLPIFWGKRSGEIREAKANLKAAEAEAQAMRNHTNHDVEEAYHSVLSSQKIVSSYEREILPQARTALKAAQTAYAAGELDFMTLIDAARSDRELRMDYYETQSQLGRTAARLQRLIGLPLEQQGE